MLQGSRRPLIWVAVVGALFAVGGCAALGDLPTNAGGSVTLDDAEAALETEFDEIESLVGGTWESYDVSLERNCGLPGGGSGVRNSSFRIATGDFDEVAAFAAVKSRWADLSYTLSEREDTAHTLWLLGTSPDGAEIEFSASAGAMGLDGLTACVPTA